MIFKGSFLLSDDILVISILIRIVLYNNKVELTEIYMFYFRKHRRWLRYVTNYVA